MRIKLAPQEIAYLNSRPALRDSINSLTGTLLSNVLELSDDAADAVRDQLGEQLQLEGFDSNYEPTEAGRILEALIDKFYAG